MQVVVLLSLLLLISAEIEQPSANNAFMAAFEISAHLNLTFGAQPSENYYPTPFLLSPYTKLFSGNIAFNYPTAEVRVDWNGADGAPWGFQTTTIVNSQKCDYQETTFNCTQNTWQLQGTPGRCWVSPNYEIELPKQMGADMNLTYLGVTTRDGYQCMVWESNTTSFVFYVRLTDLSVIEIDLPYIYQNIIPFINLFGWAQGTTYIKFTNITVGTPPAQLFRPPTYASTCLVTDQPPPFPSVRAVLESEPIQQLIKPHDMKRASQQQGPFPPMLAQAFTANFLLNGSQYYPMWGYTFEGKLAFDFTQSGFAFSISKTTGSLAFDLQTEFRLSPSLNGFDLLEVGADGECYDWFFLQWLVSIIAPRFQLNPNAVQGPNQKVNGDECTLWTLYDNQYWVRVSDNVLVQLAGDIGYYGGYSTFTLSDIKVGPVDPALYSRPSSCLEILQWSTDWNSHPGWWW